MIIMIPIETIRIDSEKSDVVRVTECFADDLTT